MACQAQSTKNASLKQLLANGLLAESELTKKQRKCLSANSQAPGPTPEQVKIMSGRSNQAVPKQTLHGKQTMARAGLQMLLTDGLMKQGPLIARQPEALQLRTLSPALPRGQVGYPEQSVMAKNQPAPKELRKDSKPAACPKAPPECKQKVKKGAVRQGLQPLELQKLLDDGLILSSELNEKQRKCLRNGMMARALNTVQSAKVEQRHKQKSIVPNGYNSDHELSKILKATCINDGAETTLNTSSVLGLQNTTPPLSLQRTYLTGCRTSFESPPGSQPQRSLGYNIAQAGLASWNNLPTKPLHPAQLSQSAAIHTGIPQQSANGPVSPHPTSEYLQQASAEPVLLHYPQPLLVISDLNGTLLFKKPRAKQSANAFKARPGLTPFLCYVADVDILGEPSYIRMPATGNKSFQLMLWTSAQPATADRAISHLFPLRVKSKMAAIWARDTLGLTDTQYKVKTQVYKKLTLVWRDQDIQKRHPSYASGGRWNQSNTVLIDDSSLKAISEPFNLINIPELTSERLERENAAALQDLKHSETLARAATQQPNQPRSPKAPPSDAGVLRRVADYLEDARWYADVSAYIRCNPFCMAGDDGRESDVEGSGSGSGGDGEVAHNDDGNVSMDDGEHEGGVKL